MYPFEKIEKKWTKKWLDTKIYEPDLDKAKKPFYNLMMFPYPSAEGLHIGNMYAFTGSDIYGRFQRMQGYDVFEPIGLDGFGIHSENYAIKIGTHPIEQSKISEKNFYRQLQEIGNGFSWDERLETYDPNYYKWTQWIFIQMYKNGLVERKKASLNWCPSCKTVLADEQVISGECERCGTTVTKKDLEQWFFKITKYTEKLLKNLEKIDWSENVKIAQKNWIGKSEGALLRFDVRVVRNVGNEQARQVKQSDNSNSITVFTTRPDTIYGATYMVLSPEHELVEKFKDRIENFEEVEKYVKKAKSKTENERIIEGKVKTGVELKGIKAINPATKEEIPVWVADYVLASYGTGAIMAVPAYDERDEEFAKKFNLKIVEAELVDKDKITKEIGGKKETHYHLRDWLISRQRYWGPPIPMIHCPSPSEASAKEGGGCGWQPVPEKDLPVLLPRIDDFKPKGTGEAPLASSPAFYKTKCPECGGEARRETDVSDTFLDSAWYFYRYLDTKNTKSAFNDKRIKKWLPTAAYIGGAEHSVLHLLYSRFLAIALKDIGLVDFDEPFTKFRAHGMIIKDGTKMSKSKGNVVNPDEFIGKFGADAVRMYLMFLGPLKDGGDWRDSGIMGIVRFLNRVWEFGDSKKFNDDKTLSNWIHAPIQKITEDIENLKYNTAIAELMKIMNRFEKGAVTRKDFESLLLLLSPFSPFITEELWKNLGNKYSIHNNKWPEYDEKHLIEDTVNLIIQINGKLRATIEVKNGISQEEAEKLALTETSVSRHIEGKPKKVIFVKDRLINFVV